VRILFVTENLPYPLDSGGRIRSFHVLKALALRHQVTLVTCMHQSCPPDALRNFKPLCSDVRLLQNARGNMPRVILGLFRDFLKNRPALIFRHYNESMAATIRDITNRESFDAVHYDHLDATVYSQFMRRIPVSVIDEHNIVSNQIFTTAKTHPNPVLRVFLNTEWLKTRRYESGICTGMSRCLVCSDVDRDNLRQLAPTVRILTIPNGVDLSYFAPRNTDANPHSTIFVGSLDYAPCDIAVQFFIRDIFPKIQSEFADASFCAVGANPSTRVQKLSSSVLGITLTGRVPDTRPYLAQSQVCVVPLKSGSGTRLKILEAMASGVPVVSTAIGAEGLEVCDGRDILIADTTEAFAVAVLRLMRDAKLAARISENALSLVRSRYSWDSILNNLLSLYESLNKQAAPI
jgi:polysaccharide biosynthesis protein PslH